MYKFRQIETQWAKYWEKNKSFKTPNKNLRKKFYVLDMFPYPSGAGLHVGHPVGYVATDIVARYKRFKGYDVLHPIGWDAFGLPAEQYAFKTGNHPKNFTDKNILNFRRQLKALGFSFDYDKEVNTTDPKFYKWTQWIFAKMYEKNLAYLADVEVNWCEKLGTVLANEEVLKDQNNNPVSERGGFPVTKRKMKQWMLRITAYADRLIDDLKNLDWPSSIFKLQKNWIGREINDDGTKQYRLRDWIFSRQRYWGEPFPILYDENGKIKLVDNLPLTLPFDSKIEIKPSGTGESPLANFKDWLYIEKNGKKYRRETNTMPQWAGSSWYYLAYILKQDDGSYLPLDSPEAKKLFKHWLPVDLYVGGQEHATLHLIYARFFHKFLEDIGIVSQSEPFQKIVNQGIILGSDDNKMSKSIGNVVNPDEIIYQYGADTLRVYEMFMGPLIDTKKWSDKGIYGIHKWLNRVYLFCEKVLDNKVIKVKDTNTSLKNTHTLIHDVTHAIKTLHFNIAISKMMVFINKTYDIKIISKKGLCNLIILLSPFAPFLAEELFQKIQSKFCDLSEQKWPQYDDKYLVTSEIELPIQINGRLRQTLKINKEITLDEIMKIVFENNILKKYLQNKKIVNKIYVKEKILNLIIK